MFAGTMATPGQPTWSERCRVSSGRSAPPSRCAAGGGDGDEELSSPSSKGLERKSLESTKAKISIDLLEDGEPLSSVTLTLGCTVRDLVWAVIRQVGPPGRLRLLSQDRVLEESEMLADIKVHGQDLRLGAEVCPSVATASADHTARIWNLVTGSCDMVLEGHTGPVCSVAVAPNFRSFLTGSEDRTAKLWGADNGACAQTLKGHTDTVFAAAYSPDCKSVVTSSADGTARVWSPKTAECKFVLEGHGSPVFSGTFSADGACITTKAENDTIKMWNSKTGVCNRTLFGQTPTCSSSFSVNGDLFVSPSGDNSASVCNTKTGETVMVLRGHADTVMQAVFATVTTGTDDRWCA